MTDGYTADDFDRAVAAVSAEPSSELLAQRLGVDWEHLGWLALDAAATVLGEERLPFVHVSHRLDEGLGVDRLEPADARKVAVVRDYRVAPALLHDLDRA